MCVSPYPHVRQHTTNPCLYWIGPYQDQALQFDLAAAQGETCTTQTLSPWSSQNMQIMSTRMKSGKRPRSRELRVDLWAYLIFIF